MTLNVQNAAAKPAAPQVAAPLPSKGLTVHPLVEDIYKHTLHDRLVDINATACKAYRENNKERFLSAADELLSLVPHMKEAINA